MSDPKRPEAVTDFKFSKSQQVDTFDVMSSLSLITALFAMFYRNRYAAWISVFSGAISWLNERQTDKANKEPTSLGNPFIFGITSLFMNYMQLFMPPPDTIAREAAAKASAAAASITSAL